MNEEIKQKRLGGLFDNGRRHQAGSIWDKNALSPTLDNMRGGYRQPLITEDSMTDLKIRKLTPTECYRLMGFTDEDCKKAADAGVSNSQLYKQAGNSIVVDVLEAIFTSLGDTYDEFKKVG